MNTLLLQELQSSPLAVSAEGVEAYKLLLSRARDAQALAIDDEPLNASMFSLGRIMILPINGLMTKYNQWDSVGMDNIAGLIAEGLENPNIDKIILLFNTYGGSVQSWVRIEEVLTHRLQYNKPVIAAIDGICASAGVYVAVHCDKIYALHTTNRIGSIGVMVQYVDTRKAEQDAGIQTITVYPPESKYKNKAEQDALDGDTKMLIEEQLTPLALHFQNEVRRYRPQLDESVEGLLEGKMFFAEDARRAGLIDGIMTLTEVLKS